VEEELPVLETSLKKLLEYKIDGIVPSLFIGDLSYEFFNNPGKAQEHLNLAIERIGKKSLN